MERRRAFLLFMALAGGVSALAASAAMAQGRGRGPSGFYPDPSSVFAADIAFNRLASEKGLWTAFRATAADDAVLLTPKPQLAKDWLKGRDDPPASQAVRWQSYRAIVSCTGQIAATRGSWHRHDGVGGAFVTVWWRDKKGNWKWIFDHWWTVDAPEPAPDALTGTVAKCQDGPQSSGPQSGPQGARADGAPPQAGPGRGNGNDKGAAAGRPNASMSAVAMDDSLRWNYEVHEDGSRSITVSIWNGNAYEAIISERVGASQ